MSVELSYNLIFKKIIINNNNISKNNRIVITRIKKQIKLKLSLKLKREKIICIIHISKLRNSISGYENKFNFRFIHNPVLPI